jgi:uncharacterized protein (DUF1499 family)
MSSVFALVTASIMGVTTGQAQIVLAEGDEHVPTSSVPPKPAPSSASYSITKCISSSNAPCVSTSNVKNLDLYLPPWTCIVSVDEVMAKLKGAVVADSTCKIVQQEGNKYLVVEATRSDLFSSIDQLEFVINEAEQVVTFKSGAITNENMDFGLNKKRLEEIRRRAAIFGIMGESMQTADSVSVGERGNGPLGQLKAFYGLQSGAGFEDVILDR